MSNDLFSHVRQFSLQSLPIFKIDGNQYMHFLLINGPNLNLLGRRETDIYGRSTLADVEALSLDHAKSLGCELTVFQSNAEHEIVNKIHELSSSIEGVIINPAAFSHTSIAIRDALLGEGMPTVEVHISNVYKREDFRHHSYISDVAIGTIVGLGVSGYKYAISALVEHLQPKK